METIQDGRYNNVHLYFYYDNELTTYGIISTAKY